MLRKRNIIGEFTGDLTADALYNNNDNDINNIASKSKFVRALHKVDLFQKAPSHVSKRTYLGAFLSGLTILFVAYLVISEFIMFLTVHREDRLSVDLQKNGKILIYFNVSFPHVRCNDLSVDSVDASGEQQINIYHRMHKNPISEHGVVVPVEDPAPIQIGSVADITKIPGSPFYCGSCHVDDVYVESQSGRQCCNTCEEVLSMFERLKKTPPPRNKIDQCVHEMMSSYPGCNMYGAMEVNKVAGNFHFAPGRSFSQEYQTTVHHVHEFNPILINRFNASHIVHELSFGEKIPYVQYPMDGLEQSIAEKSGLYKYFIKVVPTSYKRGTFGSTIESYQFSFTKHVINFDPSKEMMIPGVFFVYDLSPIKISYHDTGDSLLHFLVSMCAVVGGVFVVSGYIDRCLHKLAKAVTKKTD